MSGDNTIPKLLFTSPLLEGSSSSSSSSSSNRSRDERKLQGRQALIVLNYPISCPPSRVLATLWNTSGERICADGGANRLYHATEHGSFWIPNRIRGDLDSLNPSVRDFYASKGVVIERDPCQDTNDLDKALQAIVGCHDTNESGATATTTTTTRVVVYGAFGGRFDQEMASFQALYKYGPRFDHQIWLYSDETCAVLIPADTLVELKLPCFDETGLSDTTSVGEGPTCGLVPIGCKCDSVITSGLKWDLDGSIPLEFGGLVSTSNRIMEATVTIRASHPIVFTAEIVLH